VTLVTGENEETRGGGGGGRGLIVRKLWLQPHQIRTALPWGKAHWAIYFTQPCNRAR